MATSDSANGDESATASITYSSGNSSPVPDLRFLHYNDVYHVEAGSREPVGGIARFQTLCQQYSCNSKYANQSQLITFFSGDAFNPSLESSVTKGKHMVPPLNNVGTTVACLGNHDLDFGVDQFQYLAKQCNFPWLCANVLDPALGEEVPLAHCKRTVLLESSNGIKIGVIGVVEREWLDTINTLPPNLQYLSASATVAQLAPDLRKQGAEMIVVVSHQRQPNDDKLAGKLQPGVVDIVLGGHDHYYDHSIINGTHVLRSGSDFKQLSYLECRRKVDGSKGWDIDITRRNVLSTITPNAEALAMVEKITASLRAKLEKPMGYTSAPLDARFTTVRTKESNLGNFVCDLMRVHYNADCCIMAAGTIRGDQIYPPGVLKVREILACFPFEDPCVVVQLKGKEIVAALENSVGKYPALEGRFPQVSNITFEFDPAKEPGKRVRGVHIGDQPIDLAREYTLATRDYMVRGKDGFTSLRLESEGGTAKTIVSDENGLLLSTILRQYFMSLKVMGKWTKFGVHMANHFARVHQDLRDVNSGQPALPTEGPSSTPTSHAINISKEEQFHNNGETRESLVGRAQHHTTNLTQRPAKARKLKHEEGPPDAETDSEDDQDVDHNQDPAKERELAIMRRVMRKWRRLAGVKGQPSVCDQHAEFTVPWTQGIAPRVEGRIRIITNTS